MPCRVYACLGCALGCNDGIRSAHGRFLRVKARSLLHRVAGISESGFAHILVETVRQTPLSELLDTLHAITSYCRTDTSSCKQAAGCTHALHIAAGDAQPPRRPSAVAGETVKAPAASYANAFNERCKGVEGILMGHILKPLLARLADSAAELRQPENMVRAME